MYAAQSIIVIYSEVFRQYGEPKVCNRPIGRAKLRSQVRRQRSPEIPDDPYSGNRRKGAARKEPRGVSPADVGDLFR